MFIWNMYPWNIRETGYESVQLRTAGAGGGGGGDPYNDRRDPHRRRTLQEIQDIKEDQEEMDLMIMTQKME